MSRTALLIIFAVVAAAAAIGVTMLVQDVHRALQNLQTVEHDTDLLIKQTQVNQAMLASEITSVLRSAQVASDQAGYVALDQRALLRKTSEDSDKTVKATRVVIDRAGLLFKHTDEQLNGDVLPMFDQAIDLTAGKLGSSADAITARLDDPAIPELLEQFDAIAADLKTISSNSAAMSGDMRSAIHRIAAPPSRWHKVTDVSWTVARFGSLFVP